MKNTALENQRRAETEAEKERVRVCSDGYISILLLSYFISSGALQSAGFLLSYPTPLSS